MPRTTDLANCVTYEDAGGLYLQPCYLPFGSLPPMFLFAFFATLVGLLSLIAGCNAEAIKEKLGVNKGEA